MILCIRVVPINLSHAITNYMHGDFVVFVDANLDMISLEDSRWEGHMSNLKIQLSFDLEFSEERMTKLAAADAAKSPCI
jgi:hypothetical protein